MSHKYFYVKTSDYKKLDIKDVPRFEEIKWFEEYKYRYIIELDNNLYFDDFPSSTVWILQEFIPPNILVFSYNFYQ